MIRRPRKLYDAVSGGEPGGAKLCRLCLTANGSCHMWWKCRI